MFALCPLPGRGRFLCPEQGVCCGLKKERRGTLFVFLAALLYSVGGLCIKVSPWGGMAINGGRTAIALVVIGAYLAVTRHRLKLNRWVLLGALAVFGTNAFFSLANKMTTAANAIVLQFTAPIFVIVFSGVFFRRRPDKLDLGACAAVFQVGVAYVLLCIGLKTTPPVTASLISGIEPVLNPVLVAVFYKESVGRFALVGAGIVIASVLAYNVLKSRKSTINSVETV